MDLSSWISEITPEQLPRPYDQIVEICGIENTVKLAELFQGVPLYFAKFDSVVKEIRDRHIREEFEQGESHKKLAIKYGLTERWIYELVKPEDGVKRERKDENQTSLF